MKKQMNLFNLLLILMLFHTVLSSADVSVPSIFGKNMVLQRNVAVPVWGWADPEEKITVIIKDQKWNTTADRNGKWKVTLDPLKAGGPFELFIEGENLITFSNVLVGEVWICSGQSNMEMTLQLCKNGDKEVAEANHPNIRLFTVKKNIYHEPLEDCEGVWKECSSSTAASFSGVGYFFGREIINKLDVPVGVINASWGGTIIEVWMNREALESNQDFRKIVPPKEPVDPKEHPSKPTVLYNAMIAPLVPFAIEGVVWYQGEQNADRSYQYRELFPAFIEGWRGVWRQGDFPFLFVQLANHEKGPPAKMIYWAELREAQLMTLSVPNTAMAVTIDIGEADDIHPKNKQDVGRRLALAALKVAYDKNLVYSGPIYNSMKVKKEKIRLSFTHIGSGLVTKNSEPVKGFIIAGKDKKFVPAIAKIEGDEVVVWSTEVSNPVAVRYAWANNPTCNLYNKEGLPASTVQNRQLAGRNCGKRIVLKNFHHNQTICNCRK